MVKMTQNLPYDQNLKILTLNANSLKNKQAEVEEVIRTVAEPHVICIQETLLKSHFQLEGYNEAGAILVGNRGIRGNTVLVREGITFVPRMQRGENGIEQVGVDILLPGSRPISIVSTYLSPSLNQRSKKIRKAAIETITSGLTADRPFFVIGDLNAKINVPQHTSTNPLGDLLEVLMEEDVITVHAPAEYTRFDPAGRAPSTIDILLTSQRYAHLIRAITVHHDVGSDHRPVTFTVDLRVHQRRPPESTKPNFHKANWWKYQEVSSERLKNAPDINHDKGSIDRAAEFVSKIIKEADESAIPRVKIRQESRLRPLPQFIVQKLKIKRKLRNQMSRQNRPDLKAEINALSREIKADIVNFEENRKKRKWEETKNRGTNGFYKLARTYFKPKTRDIAYPIKNDANEYITTDTERLQRFQELYREIYSAPEPYPGHGTVTAEADEYSERLRKNYETIQKREHENLTIQFSPEMILKALQKSRNTAPGEDCVFYTHIKQLPENVLQYLAQLYQSAWDSCYYPDIWKSGTTILLPKPGKDRTDPKQYRPITLLSAIGKTFERALNKELMTFIESREIVPESQAGFRPGRSTHDQLFKISQCISSGFREGKITLAAMYDIEKSYDKIWHNGLMLKLSKILEEPTVAFIQSYLSNRRIRIRINQEYSEPIILHAGTPQGSIISPMLHNLWCSDIPQPTEKAMKLSQFADDIAIWTTRKSPKEAESKLQLYNNRIARWCRVWRIRMSVNKTQVTVFHRKKIKHKPILRVGEADITAGKSCEFLGAILDRRLTMKKQLKKVEKELTKRTKILAKITGSYTNPRADSDLSLKIFNSMILPVTTYAPSLLSIVEPRKLEKIDQTLRKGARLAMHAPASTRNEYVSSETGLKRTDQNVTRLAKKYIMNPKRSESVRALIDHFQLQTGSDIKTPLDAILK